MVLFLTFIFLILSHFFEILEQQFSLGTAIDPAITVFNVFFEIGVCLSIILFVIVLIERILNKKIQKYEESIKNAEIDLGDYFKANNYEPKYNKTPYACAMCDYLGEACEKVHKLHKVQKILYPCSWLLYFNHKKKSN